MKELYLVRHAKSSWSNPQRKDFDRPLNERGLLSASEMGKRLAENNLEPNIIVTSNAERAKETAILIESRFKNKIEIIEESRLYHASPFLLLEVVSQLSDNFDSVCLVGHNPGLTGFAEYLTNDSFGNLPTAAVVLVRFNLDSWIEVSGSIGECVLYDYPKNSS